MHEDITEENITPELAQALEKLELLSALIDGFLREQFKARIGYSLVIHDSGNHVSSGYTNMPNDMCADVMREAIKRLENNPPNGAVH